MNKILTYIAFSLLLITAFSYAEDKIEIKTENLRMILAPSVASSTAIYGKIKNVGTRSDTLIGVSSNAGMVMLHQTTISNHSAKMDHVGEYTIEPGKALDLKPMSYHLMVMNMNHDIVKKGGKVTLTLEFKKSGKLNLTVPVVSE